MTKLQLDIVMKHIWGHITVNYIVAVPPKAWFGLSSSSQSSLLDTIMCLFYLRFYFHHHQHKLVASNRFKRSHPCVRFFSLSSPPLIKYRFDETNCMWSSRINSSRLLTSRHLDI